MDGIDQLSIEDLERIDRKCCEFEKEWKRGSGVDLGKYLSGTSGLERATLLLELIALDIDYRRRRGLEPRAAQYETAYPDDRAVIAKAFARGEPPELADTSESAQGTARTAAYEPASVCEPPTSIGRYRILSRIASGGFGTVYRGFDDELERDVAIKVPHRSVISDGRHAERFLTEARLTASLNHPGIVPVYDVGRTDQGQCYVVSKFMEGGDLSAKIRSARPPAAESALIMAQVADALHCAHERRLVHRDIKPSNLLTDADGGVYLADFGAAAQESSSSAVGFVGTPAYMSPEQARGEGHRIDLRTDIFALGVVLYELLTGVRPFHSPSVTQLLADIIASDPVPPRQVNSAVAAELERICLKAMSKRAVDRYATAREFALELRAWCEDERESESAAASCVLPVVPKGLRSFDATDAEFFLQLLPGPRDRHGLPESVRFWKGRIEELQPDRTFSVGVIYGPSGGGKSSLAKAGFLPRLGRRVRTVYIEAHATQTEQVLVHALRNVCGSGGSLPELLRKLRERRASGAPKVLLVIDQFEQWLHAHDDLASAPLTAALRHCDGASVQCLLLVRHDFWMPLVRFMAELEVPLVEGENTMAVDLFDLAHARKVLRLFGQAYERLPGRLTDITGQQQQFLDEAIAAIAHEGTVSPIRLSLFAEMMKHDEWAPATLRRVGGAEGLGVAFLDRCFARPESPAPNRSHAAAARNVLRALLPESGVPIRGHFRPAAELLAASGYGDRPDRFDELLQILDHKLRLVTPTDRGSIAAEADVAELGLAPRADERYYQLTHDFLVEPIREWVTQEQRQTIRGRAELCLAERASLWTAKPEARQLPGLFEWARIRLFTDSKSWTPSQRKMLGRAGRRCLARLVVAAACVVALVLIAWQQTGRIRAKSALATIRSADTEDLLEVIGDTQSVRRWLRPLLAGELDGSGLDPRDARHMSLALLRDDASQATRLHEEAFRLGPAEIRVVRDGIHLYADEAARRKIIDSLWRTAASQDEESDRRFRAVFMLAGLAPHSPRWNEHARDVVTWLVAQPVDQVGQWLAGLGPISRHLVGALDDAFRAAASEGGQEIAAYALAHVLEENGRWEQILALVKEARPYQLPALVSILEQHGDEAVALLEDACRAGSTEVRSNLVVALVSLGRADAALPHLRHTADPTLRSYLIQNLAAARVPLRMFREYLLDGSLDADVRQALILAVGNYPQSSLGPMERERIGNTLREIYSQHADIGIHSAAEWVLRQFDFELPAIDRPATLTPRHRDWFVTPSGSTLAVLEIPEHYQPTAAAKTPARHRFAISTKEVTVQEFAKFLPQHRVDFRARHDPTCPAHMMDWYTAAAYCNWLNEREGIPEDQWCYAPNENGEYAAGMTIAADFLRRSGYRLPLSAEWLYAASGEAKTRFFFGTDADLLTDYAWLAMNSQGVQHAVGSLRPNRFGLFDVYGSVKEWAHSLESEGPQDLLATDDNQRSVLGGCFVHFATQFQANYAKHGNPPELREYLNGFRVARTILSPRAD